MIPQNIWAIGRNYAEHAKELGNDTPKSPLIFLKSGASATFSSTIKIPKWPCEIHHELEILLRVDSNLNLCEIGIALDLTDRLAQSEAKKNGTPWTQAKSFKNSCPCSTFITLGKNENFNEFQLKLWVNDNLKQDGQSKDMIFKPQQILEHLKMYYPIQENDYILTGTPSGVGPLAPGDKVKAQLIKNNKTLLEKEWTCD